MRFSFILAALFLASCRPSPENSSGKPAEEVIELSGTMKLERPENQIEIKSALPVLTEQKVTVEMRDQPFGNVSDLKISAPNKVWQVRLSGNKNLVSKSFQISTMSDNQEVTVKGVRTEKAMGETTSTAPVSCTLQTELNWQCTPPQSCGYRPRPVRGYSMVVTTFQQLEVKYDLELIDQKGKIATIATDPKIVNRKIKSDAGPCR